MGKKWALIILVATSTINASKNTWKSPYQKNYQKNQVHSADNSTTNRPFLNTYFKRFYSPKPEIKYSAQSNQNEINAYFNALQVEREYNERILALPALMIVLQKVLNKNLLHVRAAYV